MTYEIRARVRAAARLDRYDEVERLAREGLAGAPDDAELLISLAEAIALRDPDRSEKREAHELVRRAVAVAPDDGWIRQSAAITCGALGEHAEAVEHAERAVALHPNLVNAHAILAERLIHTAAKRPVGSKKILERALWHADHAAHLAPNDAMGYLVGARVRLSLGDAIGTRAWAQRGLQIEPDNPVGHQLLGAAAEQDGNYRDASSHYVHAGRLDPTSDTNVRQLRSMGRAWPFGIVLAFLFGRRLLVAAVEGTGASDTIVTVVTVLSIVGFLALIWVWPRYRARRAMAPDAKQVLAVDRQVRKRRRSR